MRVILLLAVAVAALTFSASAQVVTIKKVELAGELVIVHYDLEDSNPNNEYLLNLYSSKDNFATPLTKVTGDIGMDIKPGPGKKVMWKIRDEYGGYKGKISLEIRGKVYVPFVRLTNFDSKKTYRKGKSYPLTWKASGSNPINIELYNGGERVSGEINQPNNGAHTLFIPTHAKVGKEYKVRISDAKNSEEVVYTEPFRVGPKIPLAFKILPVVVVGAIVAVLVSKGGGGGGPDPGVDETGDAIEVPKLPGGE